MKPLWTIEKVIKAVGAKVPNGVDIVDADITGVVFDNREIRGGELFVALPGTIADGHDFAIDALERGASAALVLNEFSHKDESRFAGKLLRVDNVPDALEALATLARARFDGWVIGVTGSAGKTSTKDALLKTLGRVGLAHGSEKSYNNHVGVPISLARTPENANFAVYEMGMSAAGEINSLGKMVMPNIAIISSIGLAHKASFESLKEIALAKAEIFNNMAAGSIAILPKEISHFDTLLLAAHKAGVSRVVITSNKDKNADVYVERMVMHENCTCMTANVFGKQLTFKVGLPGAHWVSNSLNVLAAVALAGGDIGLAGVALGEMQGVEGRGVQHKVKSQNATFTLLDDSYNANPVSMKASLQVLGAIEPKNRMGCRIAVLGDMDELGDVSEQSHLALMDHLAKAQVQKLYGFGDEMKKLCIALQKQNLFHIQAQSFSSKSELLESLERQIRTGDVVLVKGSNSQKLNDVVEGLIALHQPDDEWSVQPMAAE